MFKAIPTSAEEYAALKASIQRHGRCYEPVIRNTNGKIISGKDRLRACKELGLPRPKTIVISVSDQQAEELSLELNICRKYTSLKSKRKLARLILLDHPANSDNSIAITCGLSDKTVTALRKQLEAASEIPNVETKKGRDGKSYPAHPSIPCRNRSQEKRACAALAELGPDAPPKELKLSKAEWAVVHLRKDRAPPFEFSDKDIQIVHCDFKDLQIADKSIDMFFTDPPYGLRFLSLYEELSEFASRKLKPGGILLTYVGTRELIPAGHRLEKHLSYYALVIVRNRRGVFVPVVGRKLMHGYKTMLYFSNGALPRDTPVLYDFMEGVGKEKQYHRWQQPVGEALKYIGDLSKRRDLICDPFLCTGTTAVACKQLGRRFIGCDIDLGCVNLARKRVNEANDEPNQ
jgi:hypothetical protein